MTQSCELSLCLQQVPYLTLQATSPTHAEFLFRGAFGRVQRCELGLCVALSFPRQSDYLAQAQHISLLLAATEQTLDFGLQREGDLWLLWQRFDVGALDSPDAILLALDNLLTLMRFLHGQFSASHRRLNKRESLAARFV